MKGDIDDIEEPLGFDVFEHTLTFCASITLVSYTCGNSLRRRVCGTMLIEFLKPR
jgi:hypothetical protein